MDTSYQQLFLSSLVLFVLFYHLGNHDMNHFLIKSDNNIAIRIPSSFSLIYSSDRIFNIPHSNDISHLIVTEIPHMTTPYIYATNTCRKRLSGRYSLYTNSSRYVYASSYDRQCI